MAGCLPAVCDRFEPPGVELELEEPEETPAEKCSVCNCPLTGLTYDVDLCVSCGEAMEAEGLFGGLERQ